MRSLALPPSCYEVERKLRRATNTAPGPDGLEYHHILALDPKGILLALLYSKVWEVGIPEAWKTSRTVSIYKKGDTGDYANFRPISLLSTIYKVFSGIMVSRLTTLATELGWLSPQQKGFLPGVHGIQEHSQLLQMAIEEATEAWGRDLAIALLDLCNAFGSIPHAVLGQLFESLPIPNFLNCHLHDIYSGNAMDFVTERDSVVVSANANATDDATAATAAARRAAPNVVSANANTTKSTESADDATAATAAARRAVSNVISANASATNAAELAGASADAFAHSDTARTAATALTATAFATEFAASLAGDVERH